MKKAKIFENIGLKILAVFISVLLWLVVINMSDPVISTTYSDIGIEVINSDSVTSQGKVYEITSANAVAVSVSAKRTILDSLSEDNFRAVVDLSELDEETGMAPIRVESNKYSEKIESMKSKTEFASVSIEEMLRKQFIITPVVTGEPEEGYVIGDVTTAENIVRISGAQSVVSAIKKVTAEVSVSGLSNSINTSVDLKLYDVDGNPVKDTNLTKNISTVAVSAQILATKKVGLHFTYSGEAKTGYSVSDDLTSDLTEVTIAGKPNVLNNISTLEVSSLAVNIEGLNKTTTVVVDLSKYLPDGISLVDDENEGKVTVTVPMEPIETESFEIAKKEIEVLGIPEGMTCEILGSTDFVPVDFTGISSAIQGMKLEDITAVIDLNAYLDQQSIESMSAGTYRVNMTFTLPERVSALRDVLVSIKLTEKEE